jgi:hypothetical protein
VRDPLGTSLLALRAQRALQEIPFEFRQETVDLLKYCFNLRIPGARLLRVEEA